MNLDGYVRVSEVGGRSGDAFQSPSTQIEKIERYGKAHDHSVHIPACNATAWNMYPTTGDVLVRFEDGFSVRIKLDGTTTPETFRALGD